MMTDRISKSHVEAKVDIVNRLLGHENPNFREEGTIELDRAYGGTQVVLNTKGGGSRALKHGYGTLREAALFLDGMREALLLKSDLERSEQ